jgi:sporulation protein YlmC with PRC-barrel domain
MEISIDAEVSCTDGLCGKTTCVIVDPIREEITHVVVQENQGENIEHLVPIEQVLDTTPQRVRLRCSQAELGAFPNFVKRQFKRAPLPFIGYAPEQFMAWPYVLPDSEDVPLTPVRHELVPPNELAFHRGAQVMATDGHVGDVDEFIVDPVDGHITDLVLRKGHFWNQNDVSIPVDQIDRIEADTIFLKLDKDAISHLPSIAIQQH